jgi:catechol 2,3-dioxygenase-like lactoylglutathione lyase family enzyme
MDLRQLRAILPITRLRGKEMLSLSASSGLRASILGSLCMLLCAPAVNAQSPPLAGIAHVAFRVTDLEKSRAFYQALGFEQFLEFGSDGKTTVSYMKVNDRQFIELYPRREESQPLGLMHVCYEADDIAQVHDVYAARGLNPTEVKKAHAGNLLFVLHDPEQQLLEYTQYEPGSLHSLDRGKHLGARRVSSKLIGAIVPVHDVAAERGFYSAKLGFVGDEGTGGAAVLHVAGGSGEEIELTPSGAATDAGGAPAVMKAGIILEVASTKRAAKTLRHRGLAVQRDGKDISVNDPDGFLVVFRQVPKAAKP